MPKTKKAPATKSTKTTAKKSSKTSVKKKATKVTSKKASATKTKKAASRKATSTAKSKVADPKLEMLNETGRRKANIKPPVERRKRRRQIDPTTCERDYNEQEIEFMQAMDDYKQQSGRMFPTCSEILEVLMKIGYRQVAEAAELMYDPDADKKKVVAEETLDTEYEGEDDDDEYEDDE